MAVLQGKGQLDELMNFSLSSIERIVENSKKGDESMSVSLQKFAEALQAGEDIDIEDD